MHNEDTKQVIFLNGGLIVIDMFIQTMLSLNIWVFSIWKSESNLSALSLYLPEGSVYTRGYWAKVKPGTRLCLPQNLLR